MTMPHQPPTRTAHSPDSLDEFVAEAAPFVIVSVMSDRVLTTPADSARAAQTATRHLTDHYPTVQATWAPHPHFAPALVAVFGSTRAAVGQNRSDQPVHAFLMSPGQPPSPVWIPLCGQPIDDTHLEVLDHGTGQPCPACHQRWTTHHRNTTNHPWIIPGSPASADPDREPGRGPQVGQPRDRDTTPPDSLRPHRPHPDTKLDPMASKPHRPPRRQGPSTSKALRHQGA